MSGDVSRYLALVTSEHKLPNFLAVIAALTQGHADNQTVLAALSSDFDLDSAIGAQLDAVALWIGTLRALSVPLAGVYFAWGTPGVGWGQGTWRGPFDPINGLISLPDDSFRVYLKFQIAANNWDGTIPGAYAVLAALEPLVGSTFLIQDNGDMTMIFALLGPLPTAVIQALFQQGELTVKPAGVRVIPYLPSVPNTPYFGWGVENSSISGWGVGAWGSANNPGGGGTMPSFIIGISAIGEGAIG